jgi:hypothetical protein
MAKSENAGMIRKMPEHYRSLSRGPARGKEADPSRTFFTVSSIKGAVLRAASAARMARFRTSSATTAQPAPASPARAASMAAFSARRFVWNAISS